MNKDLYSDLELAWAEYEYICSSIKNTIREIIKEDEENVGIIHIDVIDATVEVMITSCVSIYTISRIETFLGVSGKVESVGSKKHSHIKMTFEKEKLQVEEDAK